MKYSTVRAELLRMGRRIATVIPAMVLLCMAALAPQPLEAAYPPAIVKHPEGMSVRAGASVTMSVEAISDDPVSYRWRLNGTNYPGATNTSISFNPVDIRRYGDYTVVVSNPAGSVTSSVARLLIDEELTFRILDLRTNNVASTDISSYITENKGGLAVGSQRAFVTGGPNTTQNAPITAGISLDSMSSGIVLPQGFDALVSNLRTETVYTLANGNTPVQYINRTVNQTNISALIELDDNGTLTSRRINLSPSIPLPTTRNLGMFSGYDRIVLHTGTRMFNIDLPSGRVTDFGSVTAPSRNLSQSGLGYTGIAEYWRGAIYFVYVRDYYNLSRVRMPDRSYSTVVYIQNGTGFNMMATLAASLSRGRWYAHGEGANYFMPDANYDTEFLMSGKLSYTTDPGFPAILREPPNYVGYPGQTITIVAEASGAAPLSYQWFFGGNPIPYGTNLTLLLTNIQTSAEGSYRLMVANELGYAVSQPAALTVYSIPEVYSQPTSRSVFAGASMTNQVSVNGAPPLNFQWQRNGTNVSGATNRILILTNVQASDSGLYTVQIANQYGVISSQPGEMVVFTPVDDGRVFKIATLTTNSPRTTTGSYELLQQNYEYGPFALSSSRVFFAGPDQTAFYPMDELSVGTRLNQPYVTLFSNLRSETVYLLASGGRPIDYEGGDADGLIEVNGVNGALSSNVIPLTRRIPISSISQAGFFSGFGHVIILTANRSFKISLPSGVTTDLGPTTVPTHAYSISGAFWGVAEHDRGTNFIVYARDNRDIMRMRIPDGVTSLHTRFSNLSQYMASISVAVAKKRWYFHHLINSQFAQNANTVLGYANATFNINSGPGTDHLEWEPISGLQVVGQPFQVTLRAKNTDNQDVTNYNGTVMLSARATAAGASIAVIPGTVVEFTNGVWTGAIAVQQPGTNITLVAVDMEGNMGFSTGFPVSPANDLVATVQAPARVVFGKPVIYTVGVTNVGPATATGVIITNVLPPKSTLLEISASQGACYNSGQTVWCELGDLPPATPVSVVIETAPTVAGTATNRMSVIRRETDPLPANNSVISLTLVSQPALSINDHAVIEGDSGTNYILFEVTLEEPSTNTVRVNFSTSNDSAVSSGALADFVSTNGVLEFSPGTTLRTIPVALRADPYYEPTERFVVNLFAPQNASLGDPQGACVITNDDAIPVLSMTDVSVVEGNTGYTNASIQFTLSAPAGGTVTAYYITTNGTAQSGSDYSPRWGSVNFAPATTNLSAQVQLQIFSDTNAELNEVFFLAITNISNAIFTRSQASVVILNDDSSGQVDHFEWDPLPPQLQVDTPFNVRLVAKDVFENVCSNFTGPVQFTAQPQLVSITNSIFTNTTYLASETAGFSLTIGYDMTPTTNMTVTHVRPFSGSKVSIYRDSGDLIAERSVNITPGQWTEVPLSAPVVLTAGLTYRICFHDENGAYYITQPSSFEFPHGTIGATYYTSGSAFPNQVIGSEVIFLVDIGYTLLAPSTSVALSPTNSTKFTNGVWAGQLTVLEPGTNVYIWAFDSQRRGSEVGPFAFVRPPTTDTDGDSIPDEWELANGFDPQNPFDASMDSDNDGHSNLAEYLADTDPRLTSSVMRITHVAVATNNCLITFRGSAGKQYRVERLDQLGGTWSSGPAFTLSNTNQTTLAQPITGTNAFFRIRLLP